LHRTRASLAEIGGFRPLRGASAALKGPEAGSDRSKPAGKTGKGMMRNIGIRKEKLLVDLRRHTIRLPAKLREGASGLNFGSCWYR
jgi:hypothetical protein